MARLEIRNVNIDNLGDVRLKHQLNKLQEFGAHAAEAIEALEKVGAF